MNWLDPQEVEAWLAELTLIHADYPECVEQRVHNEALEQFVRALSKEHSACVNHSSCGEGMYQPGSDACDWIEVARLLVRAMEKQ